MDSVWHTGKVIRGLQNGRKFGFPTANMDVEAPFNCENGVYAVCLSIDNESYKGMLYVGTRPTLHLQQQTVEVNIFDFDRDIYDKELQFKILKQIRKEKFFSSVEELIARLRTDKNEILTFFEELY